MVARNKSKDQNWNNLVKSLEKRLKEEEKSSAKEPLNAMEVVCSHEDIEKTRQGWAKTKLKNTYEFYRKQKN